MFFVFFTYCLYVQYREIAESLTPRLKLGKFSIFFYLFFLFHLSIKYDPSIVGYTCNIKVYNKQRINQIDALQYLRWW